MNRGISVYIHIPFCRSKCSYCDFFSKPGIEKYIDSYVGALCNQLRCFSEKIPEVRKISTVYIGGGTPSLLSESQLSIIFDVIKENYYWDDIEATIELNPDDVTENLIRFLENSFINRISVGIQSLKQNVLSSMNRRASREISLKALSIIRQNFTKRFSADLIAGFPGETEKDLIENIDELLTFNPEHISLYSLCVEEGTCLYKQIEDGKINFDQTISDELWLKGKAYLEKKGYAQYEISNFAKSEGAQSKHNLNYWNLKSYLGFGSGGTGTFFQQSKDSVRYTNTVDIQKYSEKWNDESFLNEIFSSETYEEFLQRIPCEVEIIDKATEEFEFLMMNFRLVTGVSADVYNSRFSKNLDQRLNSRNDLFNCWVKKGDAEISGNNYRLTENGLLYLNNFLEELL